MVLEIVKYSIVSQKYKKGDDLIKTQKGLGLIGKLICVAIAIVTVASILLVLISSIRLQQTYENLIMEELKATAEHLSNEVCTLNDNGDWSLDGDISGEYVLLKGGEPIADEIQEIMDGLHQETGIDYTLFWKDTRVLTTIMKSDGSGRLIGTKASNEVISTSISEGDHYSSTDLNIEGQDYMGYYIPLKNSDGSVVGLVFTGRPSDDVSIAVRNIVTALAGVALAIVIIVGIVGMWFSKKLSAMMQGIASNISELADGSLSVEVNDACLKRSDEIGTIGTATDNLVKKIADIIEKTINMSRSLTKSSEELAISSDNASSASQQVACAVDEISKGAVSQAESIETAMGETNSIGSAVDQISNNVADLNDAADKMQSACDDSMNALNQLIEQSTKVSESIILIQDTIESTDASSKEIATFTEAINNIAVQTNLLSLNASIEAARAGDAGKGFAVVAEEISNLAKQSKESADKINEIVTKLMNDASASVSVMSTLSDNFNEQGTQLDATKNEMVNMSAEIANVTTSAKEISERVKALNDAKDTLGAIIEDLSAISEQNAASTEQTNASTEELAATFAVINESAAELKELADSLTATISYFN